MKLERKQYYLGEETIIEIIPEKNNEDILMKGFGVLILGPEEELEEAEEESEEKYSHEVRESIEFKDKSNLELFQMGAELMQLALLKEEEI